MVGEKIREFREKKNLSQKDVAKALGISQPAYFYFENGDRTPSWAVMKKIAKILEVSLDSLAE